MSSTTTNIEGSLETSKGWNIGLWIAQAVLALAFGAAGFMKMVTPTVELAETMAYAGGAMAPLVPFIGFVEVLGAIGLILPAATRIKPFLTPLAAAGLLTVMVLALLTHVVRGEFSLIVSNLVLGGTAALVLWGRLRKAPIQSR